MALERYEPGSGFRGRIGRTSTVVPDYDAPFAFTGTLHQVVLDLSGELITDSEAEMRAAMARQ
jgi:hypothetical protein